MYLDFADAIRPRRAGDVIEERYGNLFEMYERITDEDPYEVPMRIYPAPHYTMGGLWVDYELMTTVPGLYAAGEANFSDHGANRLGASALMQGLADGYFVLPATIGNYLAPLLGTKPVPTDHPAFQAAEQRGPGSGSTGTSPSRARARSTGSTGSWAGSCGSYCGMERTAEGLREGAGGDPGAARGVPQGPAGARRGPGVNQSLEKAGRVDDFFELATLMCRDALERNESCGGHFRAEYQTEDGEARRDDEHYAYVAAWEWTGEPGAARRPQGAARVRERPPRPCGATSRCGR